MAPDQSLSIPTLFKARFRLTGDSPRPRWCAASGDFSFRQDALAQARQDATMRFLIEMDRKLDSILALLQRASIEEDFPHKGHILRLSAKGLILACAENLPPGTGLELLLIMGGYPVRMLSVMGTIRGEAVAAERLEQDVAAYDVSYECLSEEDRESIIAFIFQEERRRIRKRKEEG